MRFVECAIFHYFLSLFHASNRLGISCRRNLILQTLELFPLQSRCIFPSLKSFLVQPAVLPFVP